MLGRRHAVEILEALNQRGKKGMTFSELQYDVVKSSSTSLLLRDMVENGIVENGDKKYYITSIGSMLLEYAQSVIEATKGVEKEGMV